MVRMRIDQAHILEGHLRWELEKSDSAHPALTVYYPSTWAAVEYFGAPCEGHPKDRVAVRKGDSDRRIDCANCDIDLPYRG